MLLASQRAVPARLKERGFRFAFPALEGALRYELGRLPDRTLSTPTATAWPMSSSSVSWSSMYSATSARARRRPPGSE